MTTAVDPLPSLETTRLDPFRYCARAEPPITAEGLSSLAESMLGVPLQLEAAAWQFCAPGTLSKSLDEPLVAAIFRLSTGPLHTIAAVELDPVLANCIVDRALGGEAEDVPPHTVEPLTETAKGVLGYLLAQILAEHGPSPWRLASIVTTTAAMSAVMHDRGQMIWPLQLELGDQKGFARVWIPFDAAAGLPRKAVPTDGASKAEVTLSAACGRASLSASEWSSVVAGDAITLDETWPSRILVAPVTGKGPRIWCTNEERGLVVHTIEPTLEDEIATGGSMTEPQTDELIDKVGDIPVEITVEVARFRLPIGELAALSAGEVLLSGKHGGQEVTLRAGERSIAKGELVEVDGEIAVKLTEVAT